MVAGMIAPMPRVVRAVAQLKASLAAVVAAAQLFASPLSWAADFERQPEFLVVVRLDADGTEVARVAYDGAKLREIHRRIILTDMPWIPSREMFEGATVSALIAPLREGATTVTAVAFDDYRVDIPIEVIDAYDPIVADLRRGLPMTLRNLGPWWIIFPFSDHPEIDVPTHHYYSVWHLSRLVVK